LTRDWSGALLPHALDEPSGRHFQVTRRVQATTNQEPDIISQPVHPPWCVGSVDPTPEDGQRRLQTRFGAADTLGDPYGICFAERESSARGGEDQFPRIGNGARLKKTMRIPRIWP